MADMAFTDRRTALSLLLAPSLASCGQDGASGRLASRPHSPSKRPPSGLQNIPIAGNRDALLYIPQSYNPERPMPLVMSLHGAGGSERGGLNIVRSHAESLGVLVLAPASRGRTWDAVGGRPGPDVTGIDTALREAFDRCNADPARLAIAGFSDGASYALTIGLTNGDLFTHVLAFSPGFLSPPALIGKPYVFLSHGTRDQVLPIERCGRRVARSLREAGYDVDYREFDGPHTVPSDMVEIALGRLVRGK